MPALGEPPSAGFLFFRQDNMTNTHQIEITPTPKTPGRYRVTDRETGQEWIASTATPFFSAARVLASLEANDKDRLEMYRPGKEAPDMVGTVGSAKGLTVLEGDRQGPRLGKFREFGMSGRDI
jgi:hypothetical protein